MSVVPVELVHGETTWMMAPRQTKETSSHSQVTGLLVCVWPGPFFFFVYVWWQPSQPASSQSFFMKNLVFYHNLMQQWVSFSLFFFFFQAFRFFLRCKMMVSKQIHFLQSSLVHFFFTTTYIGGIYFHFENMFMWPLAILKYIFVF